MIFWCRDFWKLRWSVSVCVILCQVLFVCLLVWMFALDCQALNLAGSRYLNCDLKLRLVRFEKSDMCIHMSFACCEIARWHPGACYTTAGMASPGSAGKQGVQRYIHMAYVSAGFCSLCCWRRVSLCANLVGQAEDLVLCLSRRGDCNSRSLFFPVKLKSLLRSV